MSLCIVETRCPSLGYRLGGLVWRACSVEGNGIDDPIWCYETVEQAEAILDSEMSNLYELREKDPKTGIINMSGSQLGLDPVEFRITRLRMVDKS